MAAGKPLLAGTSLAIVCPMGRDAPRAAEFVDAVLHMCERLKERRFFVVVDRATAEATIEILRAHARITPELTVVWAPENRGIVDAYTRGYSAALATQSDWILEIDAGFSHDPSDIPVLLAKMEEGYDCVFGSRFASGGSIKESSRQRYWISWGGTILANTLLGTKLHDMTSGFQLFTRPALQMVMDRGIRSRGPFFQTEMKAYCRHLHITEAPIQYRAASHEIGLVQIADAFRNLCRLFRLRLAGRL